jgi:hypothetical protein
MIGVDRIELQRGTTCVKRRGRGSKNGATSVEKIPRKALEGRDVNLNPARKIDLGKHLIPNFTCIGL